MTPFSKWKAIGYAAAIFVAGGISGGALGVYETKSHLFAPPREQEMERQVLNRLVARLDLTPDQVRTIGPIIKGAVMEIRSIRMDSAMRVNRVFEGAYVQVSAILTPDQRPKFERMKRERREMMQRWQEGHRRPGFGEPGEHRVDGNVTPAAPSPAPSAQ